MDVFVIPNEKKVIFYMTLHAADMFSLKGMWLILGWKLLFFIKFCFITPWTLAWSRLLRCLPVLLYVLLWHPVKTLLYLRSAH